MNHTNPMPNGDMHAHAPNGMAHHGNGRHDDTHSQWDAEEAEEEEKAMQRQVSDAVSDLRGCLRHAIPAARACKPGEPDMLATPTQPSSHRAESSAHFERTR